MQQWEHKTIETFIDGDTMVATENGETIRKQVQKGGLRGDKYKGPLLTDYLQEAGEDGWEVVGLSGQRHGGERSGWQSHLIILKRPKP